MDYNYKVSFVNAKINLGLNILSRRPDGYHNLQSVFYPVGLANGTPENPERFCDILEVSPASEFHLIRKGNDIDAPMEKDLVWKAMMLFNKRYTSDTGKQGIPVHIILSKNIPMQAGLGGGSADAAFTLKALNTIHDSHYSIPELEEMAAQLGADCAFFIQNRPALATGIGDILHPLPAKLSGMWAAIVKPTEGMSTAQAFSMISPRCDAPDLNTCYSHTPGEWKNYLSNDFEIPFFTLHPHLKHIKEDLYLAGAIYASLSGSGSAFFGLFDSAEAAASATHGFSHTYYTTICKLL